MGKAKKSFLASAVVFLVFVVFTILVGKVDVASYEVVHVDTLTAGPETTSIGFAGLNTAIADTIGVHMIWYTITDILGYLAILVVLFFGLLGVLQLVHEKSLARVDKDIVVLGIFYVAVMAFYVLFEVLEVNCRPVIIDAAEGLEASYPSSHTMLAVCVFTTAIFQFQSRIKNEQLRMIIEIVCAVLLVLTVGGRLLCGVHWFTDIIGSVLLSVALILAYLGGVEAVKQKK